jgi:ppGpp synthetase/RelA/SpoT-type nucleotidyltranferase
MPPKRSPEGDDLPSLSNKAVSAFESARPRYEAFGNRLKELILTLLPGAQIVVHTVEQRTKTVDSFREKIERPGKRYDAPLVDMTDLIGIRIIVYYLEDVQRVCDLLRAEFDVDEERSVDKVKELATDQFGYASVHLILSLDMARRGLAEWRQYAGMVAEVQVRTVLQHAWASISHSLQYKRESSFPSALRRRLVRLAGLFELADDEFSGLRAQQRDLRESVSRQIGDYKLGDLELSALSVVRYLYTPHVRKIVEDWIRHTGLKISEEQDLEDRGLEEGEQIAGLARLIGLRTIQELDSELSRLNGKTLPFFRAFEAARRKRHPQYGGTYGSIDHWGAVLLAGANHSKLTTDSLMDLVEWSADYCADCFSAGQEVFD